MNLFETLYCNITIFIAGINTMRDSAVNRAPLPGSYLSMDHIYTNLDKVTNPQVINYILIS